MLPKNGTSTFPIIMRPDTMKEVEIIDPANDHQPALRKVNVNGEIMIAMSAGKVILGNPVEQGRNSDSPYSISPKRKSGLVE